MNAGEVRLGEKDIYGDPVNVTSRLEKITPPGEIYFTETVYMTMNRARVLAEKVGRESFAGVEEPVTLYRVPRFASSRLVRQGSSDEESEEALACPFGGRHLDEVELPESRRSQRPVWITAAAALILILIVSLQFWPQKKSTPSVMLRAFFRLRAEDISPSDSGGIEKWVNAYGAKERAALRTDKGESAASGLCRKCSRS